MKNLYTILFLLLSFVIQAQIPAEVQIAKVRQTIAEKNLSETEIRNRLEAKGFDPENIDTNNIEAFQAAFDEIVRDLEAERAEEKKIQTLEGKVADVEVREAELAIEEKNLEQEKKDIDEEKKDLKEDTLEDTDQTVNQLLRERGDEISEKVKNGLSIQEAIAEVLAEEEERQAEEETEIYGHSIFTNSELSLYKTTNFAATPPNYVLSSGDELRISIFGRSQVDLEYMIDESGNIFPERVGKIYLRGLTYKQAEDLLRSRFARTYSFTKGQFKLSLKSAKTVSINIYGEVMQPGTYEISALNSALNALVAAGGPSENGSVRKIRLIKSSGQIVDIDVYKYLTDPSLTKTYNIDNNDIIHVPVSGNIVSVKGAIKRPMDYEMLDRETLADLIKYAGGILGNTHKKNIKITRVTTTGKKVIDANMSQALSFVLQDLDQVRFRTARLDVEEFVEIDGAVEYPGKYGANITLGQLLNKGVFGKYARKDMLIIYRKGTDGLTRLETVNLNDRASRNIKLNPQDKVVVLSLENYVDQPLDIIISGAVREPQSISIKDDNNLRIGDVVLIAGGLKDNANPKAIITRRDLSNNDAVEYKMVNIYNAVKDFSSVDNIPVQQGDSITIFENERYNDSLYTVGIEGDVRNPISVSYDESLTFNSLLLLAGGVNETASNRVILKRYPTDNDIDVEYKELDLSKMTSGKENLSLKPRDVITVYNKNSSRESFDVQVLGEVYNPGKYQYDGSLTLDNLIYMSGGLTPKASGNNVNIYRIEYRENQSTRTLFKKISIVKDANGTIKPSENIKIAPNDVIIIRPIPDYKLHEIVNVSGEVKYPGPYIISDGHDRLKSVIKQAGGLTNEAFAQGATLLRTKGDKKGYILINLKDAIGRGNAHENVSLLPGDELFIPRREDIVSIRMTGTRLTKEVTDTLLVNSAIQVAYQGKRSADWYIDNFAGGFDENVDKRSVRVIEPGGRIRSTKKFLWSYRYPKVVEGSTIAMDYKKPKEKKEGKKVDWSKTITDSMAIISSALTIIVLANQLKK